MLRQVKVLNTRVVVRQKYKKPYYGIFKIRCFATRKVFISGSKDCDKRLAEQKSQLIEGKHRVKELQEDFNKYGINRFEFKVIHRVKGKDLKVIQLSLRDRYLLFMINETIKRFQSNEKSKGYNRRTYNEDVDKVTKLLQPLR